VKKLLLFGLRQAGVLLVAFCIAWVLFQGAQRTSWFKERLYRELLAGDESQKLRAVTLLADVGAEKQLLRALTAEDERVFEMARRGLDHLWFNSAGKAAFGLMEKAYHLAEEQRYSEAVAVLDTIVKRYPKYAEAWNRRAAALWQLGDYKASLNDCQRTLILNPNHYGAWQGLGVCQLQMGELDEACRSLRMALRIAPQDKVARRCLQKCEELMRRVPGQLAIPPPSDLL
jgi:tetratricopeptide (TPR) repeat protein